MGWSISAVVDMWCKHMGQFWSVGTSTLSSHDGCAISSWWIIMLSVLLQRVVDDALSQSSFRELALLLAALSQPSLWFSVNPLLLSLDDDGVRGGVVVVVVAMMVLSTVLSQSASCCSSSTCDKHPPHVASGNVIRADQHCKNEGDEPVVVVELNDRAGDLSWLLFWRSIWWWPVASEASILILLLFVGGTSFIVHTSYWFLFRAYISLLWLFRSVYEMMQMWEGGARGKGRQPHISTTLSLAYLLVLMTYLGYDFFLAEFCRHWRALSFWLCLWLEENRTAKFLYMIYDRTILANPT